MTVVEVLVLGGFALLVMGGVSAAVRRRRDRRVREAWTERP